MIPAKLGIFDFPFSVANLSEINLLAKTASQSLMHYLAMYRTPYPILSNSFIVQLELAENRYKFMESVRKQQQQLILRGGTTAAAVETRHYGMMKRLSQQQQQQQQQKRQQCVTGGKRTTRVMRSQQHHNQHDLKSGFPSDFVLVNDEVSCIPSSGSLVTSSQISSSTGLQPSTLSSITGIIKQPSVSGTVCGSGAGAVSGMAASHTAVSASSRDWLQSNFENLTGPPARWRTNALVRMGKHVDFYFLKPLCSETIYINENNHLMHRLYSSSSHNQRQNYSNNHRHNHSQQQGDTKRRGLSLSSSFPSVSSSCLLWNMDDRTGGDMNVLWSEAEIQFYINRFLITPKDFKRISQALASQFGPKISSASTAAELSTAVGMPSMMMTSSSSSSSATASYQYPCENFKDFRLKTEAQCIVSVY